MTSRLSGLHTFPLVCLDELEFMATYIRETCLDKIPSMYVHDILN